MIVFFSTGGPFSRRPRKADLGAARLGRGGIDRGPVGRESRPRPRPVARAARSQSRKNRRSSTNAPCCERCSHVNILSSVRVNELLYERTTKKQKNESYYTRYIARNAVFYCFYCLLVKAYVHKHPQKENKDRLCLTFYNKIWL